MKESRYNIWAPAEDGGSYLYNGISGGLKHLSSDERHAVLAFARGTPVPCSAKLLEELVLGRMLIPGSRRARDPLR